MLLRLTAVAHPWSVDYAYALGPFPKERQHESIGLDRQDQNCEALEQ